MNDTVTPLKAGDVCLDCQRMGIEKYLRFFYINLDEEQILKCESDTCMYPIEDWKMFLSSSDEEEDQYEEQNQPQLSQNCINDDDFIEKLVQETFDDNSSNYQQQKPIETAHQLNVDFTETLDDNSSNYQKKQSVETVQQLDVSNIIFTKNCKSLPNIDSKYETQHKISELNCLENKPIVQTMQLLPLLPMLNDLNENIQQTNSSNLAVTKILISENVPKTSSNQTVDEPSAHIDIKPAAVLLSHIPKASLLTGRDFLRKFNTLKNRKSQILKNEKIKTINTPKLIDFKPIQIKIENSESSQTSKEEKTFEEIKKMLNKN